MPSIHDTCRKSCGQEEQSKYATRVRTKPNDQFVMCTNNTSMKLCLALLAGLVSSLNVLTKTYQCIKAAVCDVIDGISGIRDTGRLINTQATLGLEKEICGRCTQPERKAAIIQTYKMQHISTS